MKGNVKMKTNVVMGERSSTENSLNFCGNQMDADLLKTARAGDLEKVKECIREGANVHVTNPNGLNALHLAAREDHQEIAELAIEHGVDLQAVTKKRGNTALHIACLGGHLQIVRILIDKGAKLDVQAQDDITPLYMAAQENHVEIVALLLRRGASLHIAAQGGFEPLDIALQQGHSKVLAMLLEHEAKNGLRALHVAAKKDNVSMLELLLTNQHVNIDDKAANGYTALHISARHGSERAANYLIDNNAHLNACAKNGVCPIHVASKHGHAGVLSALIKAGADLSLCTKDGLTALHCSARDGHEHCVELLLVHDAPITAKSRHGLSALHMASQGNHTASARHILAHGSHIDDVTTEGVTPLHITAHYGHVETAQILVEKGADVDIKAKSGYTALHIAAKKNRESIVQLLLKHKISVNIKNKHGQIALHVAAFFGHANIVLLLLEAGSPIEATTMREETVLHIACRTTQINIVRLLLRNGAQVNPVSKNGNTPLHNACAQENADLINLLLDSGADPNSVDQNGCTCLHMASRMGDDEIVESLIDHNAQVDILSKKGFTPLHEASKGGYLSIMDMLLKRDKGALATNEHYQHGLTPLHLTCHYDQPEAAMKLLDHGVDPHATANNGFTALHIASRKNQGDIVNNLLLERGVEADRTTKQGVSPLHLAAQHGCVEIVDTLLDNGASPGVQTTNGLTALHLAVRHNQVEVVKRLLKYGANNSIPTNNGYTPLHFAALYGHTEIAKILLEDGAEIEAKTKNGNTPLHTASYKGHEGVIKLLLKYNAPPNTLNKEGYSALCVAEITQKQTVVNVLIKVTQVTIKRKEKVEAAQIENFFAPPENLEETPLVETNVPEMETASKIVRHSFHDDFNDSFPGLDDTCSESGGGNNNNPPATTTVSLTTTDSLATEEESVVIGGEAQVSADREAVVEEVFLPSTENNVEAGVNFDAFSDAMAASSPRTEAKHQHDDNQLFNGFREDVTDSTSSAPEETFTPRYMHQTSEVNVPPKKGGFLVSFNVDARGAVMSSKQTGVKIIIPRAACPTPTRITCRVKHNNTHTPRLIYNEGVVSHTFQLSPAGLQFLKPVVLEIPHMAGQIQESEERELVVMRCQSQHSSWKEHVSSLMDEHNEDTPSTHIKVVVQDLPDKLVVVSRPRKERFLMFAEGGSIQSSFMPETKIVFPPNTLNTTTKVVLQVQECLNTLLPAPSPFSALADQNNEADDRLYASAIVTLDPLTLLPKPITVTVPCPWLKYETRGVSMEKLRLLGWMPRSPRKSTIELVECFWKDITGETAVSVIGDAVSFVTTEFTKYWLVQTDHPETLPSRINRIQNTLCTTPYSANCAVYAKKNKDATKPIELEIVVSSSSQQQPNNIHAAEGFQQVACTAHACSIRARQNIIVKIGGSEKARIVFHPFKTNRVRLEVPTDIYTIELLGGLRRDLNNQLPLLATLNIDTSTLTATTLKTGGYNEDTVDDVIIKVVGDCDRVKWLGLADQLCLNKRDQQAVEDLSCGRNDIASERLLQYWRLKDPDHATYKQLYNALCRYREIELASKVFEHAPNKFSQQVEERPQKRYSLPFVDNSAFVSKSHRSSVEKRSSKNGENQHKSHKIIIEDEISSEHKYTEAEKSIDLINRLPSPDLTLDSHTPSPNNNRPRSSGRNEIDDCEQIEKKPRVDSRGGVVVEEEIDSQVVSQDEREIDISWMDETSVSYDVIETPSPIVSNRYDADQSASPNVSSDYANNDNFVPGWDQKNDCFVENKAIKIETDDSRSKHQESDFSTENNSLNTTEEERENYHVTTSTSHESSVSTSIEQHSSSIEEESSDEMIKRVFSKDEKVLGFFDENSTTATKKVNEESAEISRDIKVRSLNSYETFI